MAIFWSQDFGADCLDIMSRDGDLRVLADTIERQPPGNVNFALRDSRERIWVAVSRNQSRLRGGRIEHLRIDEQGEVRHPETFGPANLGRVRGPMVYLNKLFS